MILKVPNVTTGQFYSLVEWLASGKNCVTVATARKLGFHDDESVSEVTRTFRSRHHGMSPNLTNVVRILSVKGNLKAGETRDQVDSYDLVLEVPQAMFLQQLCLAGETRPAPRLVAIPPDIMAGVMDILADNPNYVGERVGGKEE